MLNFLSATTSTGILDGILEVFSLMITWIIGAMGDMTAIFYSSSTGLTLIGVLAVAGLAIAVTMLIFNYVKDFIRFR